MTSVFSVVLLFILYKVGDLTRTLRVDRFIVVRKFMKSPLSTRRVSNSYEGRFLSLLSKLQVELINSGY